MNIADIKKTFAWLHADEVSEICQPFFKALKINYFDYARYYPDGTALGFCSDKDYFLNFMSSQEYINPSTLIPTGSHLWQAYIPKNFLEDAKMNFNHEHGITFLINKEDYVEGFNFAAEKNNTLILDIYLNAQEVFRYFVNAFLERFSLMIQKHEKQRILLPGSEKPLYVSYSELIMPLKESLEFEKNLKLEKKPLGNFIPTLSGNIKITDREKACLKLLFQGYTNKRIAKLLLISDRTVETYTRNLRGKFGVKNNFELINFLDRNLPHSSIME